MTGNAMSIDMVRMASQARAVRSGQKAPEGKETDFAQIMKRKDQILKGDDEKENSSVQNAAGEQEQDNEPVTDKTAPENFENGEGSPDQEDLAEVQVSSEAMLQLQSAISRLLENSRTEQALGAPGAAEPVQDIKAADQVTPAVQESGSDILNTDPAKDSPQQLNQEMPFRRAEAPLHNQNQNSQGAQTVADGTEEAAGRPVGDGVEEPVRFSRTLNDADSPKEAALNSDVSPGISKQQAPEEGNQGSREGGQTPGEPVQAAGTQEHFTTRTAEFRQPETPVVKTTPETLPNDLGKTLAQSMPKQNGTLTIELEPASLGKLTISVVYEEGKAAVSILATNPKTLELLTQRAGDIANILEEKTGQQTVIYTQEPEQPPFDERPDDQEKGQQRQDREDDKKQSQPDSFAQQLRLGLV